MLCARAFTKHLYLPNYTNNPKIFAIAKHMVKNDEKTSRGDQLNYLTHKAGGTLGMLIAFDTLKRHGMLLTDINPYIQLLIMYPAASWGSTAPDLDRFKNSIVDETPVNLVTSGLLKVLGAKHRSWQTHCLIITGGMALVLPVILESWAAKKLGYFDLRLLRLLIYGFVTGVLSHLFLDALTPEGIHLVPYVKIRLVPRITFFSTGGIWEKFVCAILYIAILVALLHLIFGITHL